MGTKNAALFLPCNFVWSITCPNMRLFTVTVLLRQNSANGILRRAQPSTNIRSSLSRARFFRESGRSLLYSWRRDPKAAFSLHATETFSKVSDTIAFRVIFHAIDNHTTRNLFLAFCTIFCKFALYREIAPQVCFCYHQICLPTLSFGIK